MFLEPLSIEKLNSILGNQGKEVINYFISKSIFAQPEKISENHNIALRVPKEHIEEWFIQALKVEHTGSGSYPVDFINTIDLYGADIKALTYKISSSGYIQDSDSGETSLGQNFKDAGKDLDTLFSDKNYNQIVINWKKFLNDKLKKPSDDHKIKTIYYFFILLPNDKSKSDVQKIYLCRTQVNVSYAIILKRNNRVEWRV